MTGVAVGMALAGLRPIHVHIRMDFLMLAMNQLVNVAAKCRYMYGGRASVPMVVRSMIGKSWGQGAQHSQGLYSFFMHVPGLKVAAPSTPYDAKGCLIAAIRDDDPVLYVEHRMLHFQSGPVPEGAYTVAPGRARITAAGDDVTLVGVSQMQIECLAARRHLETVGVRAEVIDPVWLSPLDVNTIAASAEKTGRLIVVDNGWTTCGAGAEIVAQVAERLMGVRDLPRPPPRLRTRHLPDGAEPGGTVLSERMHHRRRRARSGGRSGDRLDAGGQSGPAMRRIQGAILMQPTATRQGGLDWPLMKNNITRDDLDAVCDLLRRTIRSSRSRATSAPSSASGRTGSASATASL